MHDEESISGGALAHLFDAILAIAGEDDLHTVLQRFVRVSAELTGAQYAAIDVRDARSRSTTFASTGVPGAFARALKEGPQPPRVLGQLPAEGALRLADLRDHPSFQGYAPDRGPSESFLGATLHVGRHVYGHLYMSDKPEAFTLTDELIVAALATAAGIAIANAQLSDEAERREAWLRAEQAITTMLLEGVDDEQALLHIATAARHVGDADTVALALPGVGGELLIEMAVGYDSDALIGVPLPAAAPGGEARATASLSLHEAQSGAAPALLAFGPALFAPLRSPGRGIGVLIFLRRVGAPFFDDADLVTAESFAAQAVLAYIMAEVRTAQDAAALLDERARIARDLHDLAIQQLFATGMQLETVRRRAASGIDAGELTAIVDVALENIDGSIRQIRQIVHELRVPDASVGLAARLHREVALARIGLGFAPALHLTLDGVTVPLGDVAEDRLDERVAAALTSDVVAVVREGLANAARHAQADTVSVWVAVSGSGPDGEVVIEVQDDGVGPAAARTRQSGIANLAARAQGYDGTFSLVTAPGGKGALLSWTAPLSWVALSAGPAS